MQKERKLVVGILLVVLLLTISTVPVALADPVSNPNTFIATLQCGPGTVTFVVSPSNSPTLSDLDSTGGFRLTQVDFTIIETGATGSVPYGAGHGEAVGLQDNLTTCFVTEVRDGLTFEFELTGFVVPR